VTIATGHGKKAARYINGYLRGEPYLPAEKNPVVGYERLHLWYRINAPQQDQPELPLVERLQGFDEILQGL